jgi:hypothetical protein
LAKNHTCSGLTTTKKTFFLTIPEVFGFWQSIVEEIFLLFAFFSQKW